MNYLRKFFGMDNNDNVADLPLRTEQDGPGNLSPVESKAIHQNIEIALEITKDDLDDLERELCFYEKVNSI